MNNTLTAIEWVCKETGNTPQMYQLPDFNLLEPLMEGYANYKNRILEDRIKEFRRLLKEEMTVDYDGEVNIFCIIDNNDMWHYHDIFKVYDKHFDIENKQ